MAVPLRFLTLRANPNALIPQYPSYAFASRVQNVLRQEFLDAKENFTAPPPPTVICFTPAPVYTLGRRQTAALSLAELERLQSPLFVQASNLNRYGARVPGEPVFFTPTVTRSLRGGLATYHGPGQLVLWPVIDMHSPLHQHLTMHSYAFLLQQTTISALRRMWSFTPFMTKNPGVWVMSLKPGKSEQERKIASIGVYCKRYVTALGVAINYSTPVTGPEETNPWGRIVPCGLVDRDVTSARAELGLSDGNGPREDEVLKQLGDIWQQEFVKRLNMHVELEDESLASFDVKQSMDNLEAQVGDSDDRIIEAQPISNLKT
ncbi:hypothetical protein ANO14919_140830 [Xylariales sp. No.14919]|nr:hypothetical protein F5X98DRAFT_69583 [Xylaria grammica]GAW24496.1 hypothetical protein ANO14919_140830 [Xylariales sp. No.14919]